MATFLQYKNDVARYIGENDYTSLESVIDNLINDVIRNISSLYPFKCNKTSAEVTTSSGVGDLPTDLDYSHIGKIRVYYYSSTTKYEYELVDFDEFTGYSSSEYVYTIDFANNQIKIPDDQTITIDYYMEPTALSGNTDKFEFPIPEAISRLVAGQFWQSFEEDFDQSKLNFSIADGLIKQAVDKDKRSVPYRNYRPYGGRELGFNKNLVYAGVRGSGYKK
jgi:hypothetical protein